MKGKLSELVKVNGVLKELRSFSLRDLFKDEVVCVDEVIEHRH
jgi:hypothetical protein